MYLPIKKAEMVLSLPLEGNSISSVERASAGLLLIALLAVLLTIRSSATG